MIENAIDKNPRNSDGNTPLHIILYRRHGDTQTLRELLRQRDDLEFNIRNNNGKTVIEYAIEIEFCDMAKMMLYNNLFLNSKHD